MDGSRLRIERYRRRVVRKLVDQGRWAEAESMRAFYERFGPPRPLPPELVAKLEPMRQEFLRKSAGES